MAIYLIGDIQGCHTELLQLVDKINFNAKKDQLWFCGDLVARGPDSLATLRYIKGLGKAAKTVLGNHDLHLIATYHGIGRVNKKDKLEELLNAKDCAELMDWLLQQPLVLQLPDADAYLSHAGLPPEWTPKKALKMSAFVQKKLQSKKRKKWLRDMYGDFPNKWQHAHSDIEKFRFTVNAMTRMRFCYQDGGLELNCKGSPQTNQNKHLQPWYEVQQNLANVDWIFGHWAALEGNTIAKNIHAIDTGCVWGGTLTALRWPDKKLFQVNAVK
ncbi:symmetrical bis(5'-nucleosyl)-tetraphosphatase [Thalassotalea sp. HSM 43]|uniref:symmetrical bis(5'-nucleosyl)-tetraphosphatase n=1 Tax=Thalassotalea sp. HSM 43 TaxID=2552945 RepID=UPI00107FE9E7|nr:symmetrical bis(5'-nucleosyl)-tetraphosphatase [Thalassotalea sp. HSM 43]QBY04867.1 symmetrical bis(5'-nucleosyl)-tetraphosphatase [Thalassotalea sp. HSM 43]